MDKKMLFLGLALIVALYPILSAYWLELIIRNGEPIAIADPKLSEYLLSIWLSWVLLMAISIYYKWSKKGNLFFVLTYIFILITAGIFSYFLLEMVNLYDLESGIKDPLLFSLLKTLQNFAPPLLFTVFLQAAVWWFTRKWHRR